MNQLQIFNNSEFGEVRFLEVDNKPYAVASDVAKTLGYTNPHKAIKDHCKNTQKICTNDSLGRQQEVNIIPESDIYRLIIKSKLPAAERFENWVMEEVLPTIRKHGVYMTDEVLEKTLEDPDYMIGLLTKLKEEKNLRLKVEKERDLLIHDDKTYTTTELAKELGFRSARAFNQELYNRGIQYPVCGSWVLYSKYAAEGYTELKQSYAPNGEIIYYTKWTGKGRMFLLKLFNK